MQVRKLKTTAMLAATLLFAAGLASADEWNKKTILTVSSPIEVPGAVLPPGEYVMKLVDSPSNRHVVRFMNADEDEVISTVIAIPNQRLEPTGDTQFSWYETPAGSPPAMRAWFYPGDNFGQEFVYPEGRAATLAATRPSAEPRPAPNVVAVTPAPQPEPEREVAQVRTPEPRPAPPPVAAQPAPRPTPRPAPQPEPVQMAQNTLPETAGFASLLALIGLSSLGGAVAIGRFRRK